MNTIWKNAVLMATILLIGCSVLKFGYADATEAKPGSAVASSNERFEVGGVSFEMVSMKAGEFMMGSDDNELGHWKHEGPKHAVRVSAFKLGQTEVTQALWQSVLGENPSKFKQCGPQCPVDSVSWNEAQLFISKLNALTGKHFRLPSEAEWEYAARAGCSSLYSVGRGCVDQITSADANFDGKEVFNGSQASAYLATTTPVGSYAPNQWGFFDMHGNVKEWVVDCENKDYKDARNDSHPYLLGNCDLRGVRGASFNFGAEFQRLATRGLGNRSEKLVVNGLRLAMDVAE